MSWIVFYDIVKVKKFWVLFFYSQWLWFSIWVDFDSQFGFYMFDRFGLKIWKLAYLCSFNLQLLLKLAWDNEFQTYFRSNKRESRSSENGVNFEALLGWFSFKKGDFRSSKTHSHSRKQIFSQASKKNLIF